MAVCRGLTIGLVFAATGLVLAAEPAKFNPDNLASYDSIIKPRDRKHWAFQPVRQPELPKIQDAGWVRNAIDAFILAKLEEKNWKPNSDADAAALLRRIYLDVIGLPPTLKEQVDFLSDSRADKWERLIDDLLKRPQYGERWGRHWLDLVRYAETNGFERDGTKPHVWRYRDYVIDAFNADKPFDRFILEQLAGDEIEDSSSAALIATGFYRLGPWDDEPADPKEDRFDQIDDMINTTAQVFLGLTLGCARCHNHKFEPLTMHDYYRMAAIFNTLSRPQIERLELDRPAGSRSQVEVLNRRDREIRRLGLEELQATLASGNSWASGGRRIEIEKRIDQLRRDTPDLPRGYFLEETSPQTAAMHLLKRGKCSNPGPEVQPGVPAVLVSRQPDFLPAGRQTSRRRLTLARWIASADNPLTARVIVNRVWQFHFGEGLVRTPSDFGVMGESPTHPELLDWLTDWFIREGWSIKKLHRLILTSHAYRMSKMWNKTYGNEDPENRLWWRVPYRRLEVEAIRDSMLAVSGRLNPKMYGPSMFPPVPKEALEGSSDPDKIWKASDEAEASRRTIYAAVKRSMVVPFLEVLDFCDTTRTSAKRNITSVAPQALALFNGEFVNRQAENLARRLEHDAPDDAAGQIDRALRLVVCRPPTSKERTKLETFLKEETHKLNREARDAGQKEEAEGSRHRALVQAMRVILNLNEFFYPD